jgi:predicted amidohydrolase YtcJ
VDLLHAAAAQPGFPVRITAAVWGLKLDDMTKAGLKVGSGDDMVRTEFVKWVADGSNQGLTGYMREPYLNSESRGVANYTVDELVANFTASLEAGWPLMMHGNGDAGIDNILEALEQVSKLPVWDASLRHRIEHCSILHDEQIAQMAALGVNPSFLMNHVRLWGRAFRDDILGAERANLLDRVRSAQAAGLRPSLHCDYSVSPMNPLDYVCTAVTRTMADGGDVLNPDERISVADALKGITTDAAWMCRSDDLCGSIEVGKAADFTVLAADPTVVEPEAIREIEVRQTWLDGEVRFSA